jgi:hypothetical protein
VHREPPVVVVDKAAEDTLPAVDVRARHTCYEVSELCVLCGVCVCWCVWVCGGGCRRNRAEAAGRQGVAGLLLHTQFHAHLETHLDTQ